MTMMILGELCNFAGVFPVNTHCPGPYSQLHSSVCIRRSSRCHPDGCTLRRYLCHPVVALPQRNAHVLWLDRVFPLHRTTGLLSVPGRHALTPVLSHRSGPSSSPSTVLLSSLSRPSLSSKSSSSRQASSFSQVLSLLLHSLSSL